MTTILKGLLLPELARVVDAYVTLPPFRGDRIVETISLGDDVLCHEQTCHGRVAASPVRDEVWCLGRATHPDPQRLVRMRTDGTILDTMALFGSDHRITSTTEGHIVLVNSTICKTVVLSPDGKEVAVWQYDRNLLAEMQCSIATLWDPDVGGHVLLLGTRTSKITVFDLFRGTLLREWHTPFSPACIRTSQQWIIVFGCWYSFDFTVYDRLGNMLPNASLHGTFVCGAANQTQSVFLTTWGPSFEIQPCNAMGRLLYDDERLLQCYNPEDIVILSDGRVAVFDDFPDHTDRRKRMRILR